ncbi:hypothetical protein DMX12_21490 [Pseudomonas sp. MB-090624]|nr:hypothetical protein DMX12_21490 [Pseudomonas sp. MB-090624]
MVVQLEIGVGFFAGKPAPTGLSQGLRTVEILWEASAWRSIRARAGRMAGALWWFGLKSVLDSSPASQLPQDSHRA